MLNDAQGKKERNDRIVVSLRKRLDEYTNDSKEERRMIQHECKYCYYLNNRIGGSAMTNSACRCCNTQVLYSSTCVGAFCMNCAVKLNVCTHCGSEMD